GRCGAIALDTNDRSGGGSRLPGGLRRAGELRLEDGLAVRESARRDEPAVRLEERLDELGVRLADRGDHMDEVVEPVRVLARVEDDREAGVVGEEAQELRDGDFAVENVDAHAAKLIGLGKESVGRIVPFRARVAGLDPGRAILGGLLPATTRGACLAALPGLSLADSSLLADAADDRRILVLVRKRAWIELVITEIVEISLHFPRGCSYRGTRIERGSVHLPARSDRTGARG